MIVSHFWLYLRGSGRGLLVITGSRIFFSGSQVTEEDLCQLQISMIWSLFEDFPDEDCRRAMDESLRYNCSYYAFLKGFLSSHTKVWLILGVAYL